jgi:hypothetical protein
MLRGCQLFIQNHSDVINPNISNNIPKTGDIFICVVSVNKVQGKMITATASKLMKSKFSIQLLNNLCEKAQRTL